GQPDAPPLPERSERAASPGQRPPRQGGSPPEKPHATAAAPAATRKPPLFPGYASHPDLEQHPRGDRGCRSPGRGISRERAAGLRAKVARVRCALTRPDCGRLRRVLGGAVV